MTRAHNSIIIYKADVFFSFTYIKYSYFWGNMIRILNFLSYCHVVVYLLDSKMNFFTAIAANFICCSKSANLNCLFFLVDRAPTRVVTEPDWQCYILLISHQPRSNKSARMSPWWPLSLVADNPPPSETICAGCPDQPVSPRSKCELGGHSGGGDNTGSTSKYSGSSGRSNPA